MGGGYKGVCMRRPVIFIILLALITGCSQPIAIYNKRLYVGIFEHENIEYEGGEYNKLKGAGVSVGLLAVGLGYYDLHYLRVDKRVAKEIVSPIAAVMIGYEHDPFNYIFIRSGK